MSNHSVRSVRSLQIEGSIHTLPISSWYERARERVWKKYGSCHGTAVSKRVYPQHGLLGYKVLIDGFNNTFSAPPNQGRGIHSGNAGQGNQPLSYGNFSEKERRKFQQMKIIMKRVVLEERRRQQVPQFTQRSSVTASQIVPTRVRKGPATKTKTTVPSHTGTSSSSELSHSLNQSVVSEPTRKHSKVKIALKERSSLGTMPSVLESSTLSILQSSNGKSIYPWERRLVEPKPFYCIAQNKWSSLKKKLFTLPQKPALQPVPSEESIALVNPQNSFSNLLTKTYSTLVSKLPLMAPITEQTFQPGLFPLDAYFLSTARPSMSSEVHPLKPSLELIASSQTLEPVANPLPNNTPTVDPQTLLDMESHLHLPERPKPFGVSPIKGPMDLQIHRSTMKSYERRSAAGTRTAAINCIQEATYFKGKSWLKQIEISKQMIKQQTQRTIRQAQIELNEKSARSPLRATVHPILASSKSVPVQ